MFGRKNKGDCFNPTNQAKKFKIENGDGHYPEKEQRLNVPSLSPDTITYLTSLASHLSQDDSDVDTLPELIDRCKEECENIDPISLLLCDQVSEAFESICSRSRLLSKYFLEKLLKFKRKKIKLVFERTYSARTIETMLYKIAEKSINAPPGVESQASEIDNNDHVTFIEQISSILIEEIDSLCTEYSGSHVIRCLGRILCGLGKNNHVINNHRNDSDKRKKQKIKLIPEFKTCLTNFLNFILDWNYISGYLNSEPVSLLVQEFIELDVNYAKTDHLSQFIDGCLEHNQKAILNHICDKQASRVYEKLILHCDESKLERFIDVHLKSNLQNLTMNKFGNFVIQRILERCKSEEMINDLFEELMPFFSTFWTQKKFGVVVGMAQAAAQSKCKQKELKKMIFELIGCKDEERTKSVIPLLLQLKNYDDSDFDVKNPIQNMENIKLHGSLLVQNLLKFKRTDDIAQSLLSLNASLLINLICHNAASRIFDQFFISPQISQEFKDQLLGKLKANLHKIACDRVGSRVLECIFGHVTHDQFVELLLLLLRKETALRNSQAGKIIMSKYELDLFKRNRKQWNSKYDKT